MRYTLCKSLCCEFYKLRTIKGIGNREKRIRISIHQKSCIVEYTVSDKLKFLRRSHNRRNKELEIKNKNFNLSEIGYIGIHGFL